MNHLLLAKKTGIFLAEVEDEIRQARRKFPDPSLSTVALMEEVGELAKALLQEQWSDSRTGRHHGSENRNRG